MPTIPMRVIVSTYAIGSLLQLSSSSNGFKLFFNLSPFDFTLEHTDADPVDDMVGANSKEVIIPIEADLIVKPSTSQIASPVNIAVNNTPIVARITPWVSTGRISSILVSIPPENKIIHRATELMV